MLLCDPLSLSLSCLRRFFSEARKDLSYDAAFMLVKNFLERAMDHTVEEVQTFGSTHVPAPPWVTVVPVIIPPDVCALAARVIIDHMGEEQCERVVGGCEWWQRRARKDGGVEAEWISMRRDWQGDDVVGGKGFKQARRAAKRAREASGSADQAADPQVPYDQYESDMDESPRTMLYIHVCLILLGFVAAAMLKFFVRTPTGRCILCSSCFDSSSPWQPVRHLAELIFPVCSLVRSTPIATRFGVTREKWAVGRLPFVIAWPLNSHGLAPCKMPCPPTCT